MVIPLDMLNLDSAAGGPWTLDVPDTTTFVLVGANDELTGIPQGIAAAIADVVGAAIDIDRPEATPPGVPWIAALHVPGLPAPLLCWPEAEAVDGTGLPEDLEHRHGLVVQTLLHPGDPLTCLVNVARLLAMIDQEAPGVLDADTGRWLDRSVLARDFLGDVTEPSEDVLWVVEANRADDGCQVCSRGLARCGRQELLLTGVHDEHLDAAADLVASVAALSLETPLPATGVPAEIGPGLHVHVVALDDRAQLVDEHGETPTDVLQRLRDGVAAIYRTDRSARRRSSLARTTWNDFLVVAKLDAHDCLVEVPFEDPEGEEQRREHVWMRVEAVQGDAVIAAPVHEPTVAVGVDMGPQRIDAAEVASWRVMVDDQAWGPEQLDLLKDTLNQ